MTTLTPLTDYLCDTVDQIAENLSTIAAEIEPATSTIVHTLLHDKKLLICGTGFASALAQIITEGFMNQHEFDRPGFPAINLTTGALGTTRTDAFKKQIEAIGIEGDTLIICCVGTIDEPTEQLISTALEKGISIIALDGAFTETNRELKNCHHVINLHAKSVSDALELGVITANTLIKSAESKIFGLPLNKR